MMIDYQKIKDKLDIFGDNLYKSKKYWLIYLAIVAVISLTLLTIDNYRHPKMEIITIILVSLLGVFAITFYSYHNDDKQLYKTAFIVILIFGILCSLLNPIMIVLDETEHSVRSEITSQGIIIPEYKNNSFETIQSIHDIKLYKDENIPVLNGTVFTNNYDDKPINYSKFNDNSAFAQNPFYGYLPQAIGMFVAKLLDLNAIWLLWLGRIFNLICYAALVSYAIKKSPVLKMPLLVVSCIPLCIYQAASLSIDSLINGLSILLIAFFLDMYKSPKESITKKDIIIFAIIGLLLGLCKWTSFLLVFLVLCVPKSNFKDKNYYYGILSIFILGIIGILWAKFYMVPGLNCSYRVEYAIARNINSTAQIEYLLSHNTDAIITLLSMFKYVQNDLLSVTYLYYFNYPFLNLYLLFLGSIVFLYPISKFSLKSKIGVLLILISNFVAVHVIELLSWTPVGQISDILGAQPRYFLPLFALFPIVFGINHIESEKIEFDNYIVILVISFLASLIIAIVAGYY